MNGSLDEKIEQVRIEMIQTVERLGMTSKETIEISQKLDELINQSIHQKTRPNGNGVFWRSSQASKAEAS